MRSVEVPNINEIIDPILNVEISFEGEKSTIKELRGEYLKYIDRDRKLSKIRIFNIFASAMLERQMMGESYTKRIKLMNKRWKSYDNITKESIKEILKEAGYRFQPQGLQVIQDLKALTEKNFEWANYFKDAEKSFEDNFPNDHFLKIKFVGYKVRDFALSEFTRYYLANDLHIIKMIKRTGLLINGYGDIDIGTNPFNTDEYLFLKRLVIRLSKESGWKEGKGYSPGEIDKIFWHFGRNICKADPLCDKCPIKKICLTGKNRKC